MITQKKQLFGQSVLWVSEVAAIIVVVVMIMEVEVVAVVFTE